MLLLFLKGKQLQAGADWDSVITISTSVLLVASLAIVIGLIIARVRQNHRMKRARRRAQHRHP